MRLLAQIIATFFGAGYFPIAPGTFSSLLVLLIYRLYLHQWDWRFYLFFLLALYFLGVWSASIYASQIKKKDPRTVVIDEVLGQLVALFLIGPSWTLVMTSFVLFRIFDILKPLLIKKSEDFASGWGVMLDDIIAGIYASICVNTFQLIT